MVTGLALPFFFFMEVIFVVAFDSWCHMALIGNSGSAHTTQSAMKQALHETKIGYTELSCVSAFPSAQVQGRHALAHKALVFLVV